MASRVVNVFSVVAVSVLAGLLVRLAASSPKFAVLIGVLLIVFFIVSAWRLDKKEGRQQARVLRRGRGLPRRY